LKLAGINLRIVQVDWSYWLLSGEQRRVFGDTYLQRIIIIVVTNTLTPGSISLSVSPLFWATSH